MALSVLGLGKRYGDRIAFQDVSFEANRGEVFGFLGPERRREDDHGADPGHTDLPDLGLGDGGRHPAHTRIAVMPESPWLYLRLSVAENLACFADLYEVPDPPGRVS